GLELHPFEQLARVALVLVAVVHLPAHLLQLPCALVAQPLEMLEAQEARAAERRERAGARGGDEAERRRGLGADVGERGRDQARTLALELGDLCAQRAPGGPLVYLLRGPYAAIDGRLLEC